MIPGWALLLVSLGYVGLLFGVAYAGDRGRGVGASVRWRPVVYALGLAVYCSSWTFYGAVGSAARTGLGFLPIYLGPILLMLLGWRILERLVLISGEQRIVSIADFLSSRYGRAPGLAALVAALAVLAAVPYLALQFKAVAMSVEVLAPGMDAAMPGDAALLVALLLAAFAIAFGTRRIDATEHHRGMVLAIALESLVKLVAFVAVGVLALMHLPGQGGLVTRMGDAAQVVTAPGLPGGFLAQTVLAFAAAVCLPRQFHVAVVECQDPADLRPARWIFAGYLAVFSLFVVPITLAGQAVLAGSGASPDSYVLALPLALDHRLLAMLAYVGGFSAATGMVIVASVALATMVSNDLVLPLLLRGRPAGDTQGLDRQVLWVRRATIVALALMAYGYHRGAPGDTLAQYGLLAFAAVAQFAPALLGGLYWRGASRSGAFAGVLTGALAWAYTLMLPALTRGGLLDADWLAHGPLGLQGLRPEQLFGLAGWDALTHGVFWSLLLNTGAFVLVSARQRPRLQDQLRAAPFLDPYAQRPAIGPGGWAGSVRGGELLALAERIVGERAAARAFAEFAAQQQRDWNPAQPADRALAQFTERLLASAIGAASARLTLTSALRGSGMELGEVVALLDEATQELRFNRQVLAGTLDNISQGVSVVDGDMRLVSWNRRYQELFDYPDGMLYIGRPVADLIRFNAERGELGAGDVDEQVERRLAHLRAGVPHVFERVRANGQVIEMRGRPVEGGGYVTSYSDVTDYKRAEQALLEVNETLEQRVEARTREAEAAQLSKTRFLAAVSHDLLQPLNAARLFASALRESEDVTEQQRLAERVDAALRAAEDLLDGLLDVSRLDAGALRPERSDFDLVAVLHELAAQYAPHAVGRGLRLRVRTPAARLAVHTDARLLRRALQNFLANALRYTRSGGVLLAARVRGDAVQVQVWDTGPGIPAHHLEQIFEEFRRFERPGSEGERGLGLGLSICQRIARTLDHPLQVRSRVGHGSMFSITVPLGHAGDVPAPASFAAALGESLSGLHVLCVDNDREILEGMRTLLARWHASPRLACTVDEALAAAAAGPIDVALVDFHLHDRLDGLGVIDALRAHLGRPLPAALLTGDGSDAVKQAARERDCIVLTKPVKPASLRAFLAARLAAGASAR